MQNLRALPVTERRDGQRLGYRRRFDAHKATFAAGSQVGERSGMVVGIPDDDIRKPALLNFNAARLVAQREKGGRIRIDTVSFTSDRERVSVLVERFVTASLVAERLIFQPKDLVMYLQINLLQQLLLKILITQKCSLIILIVTGMIVQK